MGKEPSRCAAGTNAPDVHFLAWRLRLTLVIHQHHVQIPNLGRSRFIGLPALRFPGGDSLAGKSATKHEAALAAIRIIDMVDLAESRHDPAK